MLKRSATTILVIVFIGMLGHSLGCGSPAPHSTIKPFKNRAKWNFATEQEYQRYTKLMNEQAASEIRDDQADINVNEMQKKWTAAQAQAELDSIEQARTGDSSAHSCRKIVPNALYDYSQCSQEQLTAELFQQKYLRYHQP